MISMPSIQKFNNVIALSKILGNFEPAKRSSKKATESANNSLRGERRESVFSKAFPFSNPWMCVKKLPVNQARMPNDTKEMVNRSQFVRQPEPGNPKYSSHSQTHRQQRKQEKSESHRDESWIGMVDHGRKKEEDDGREQKIRRQGPSVL
jgi:hypothetical protein